MQPGPVSSSRATRPALWLVLVALLLVSALQLAELSHHHATTDAAEHCLLCKAEGAAAVTTCNPESEPIRDEALAASQLLSPAQHGCQLPLARGPPALS